MKKLNLQLDSIKEMVPEEQMKKLLVAMVAEQNTNAVQTWRVQTFTVVIV